VKYKRWKKSVRIPVTPEKISDIRVLTKIHVPKRKAMPQPAQNMIESVMYGQVKYPVTVEVFTSKLPTRARDIWQFLKLR